MPRPRLVTLTTDVGPVYAAQMRAVLYSSLPPGSVVDLADDLAPHRVGEAGFFLHHAAERFPAGTVHLAVVDPGVGGRRAPVAIETADGSRLVGPDNGLLVPLAEALGVRRVMRLDPKRVAPGARVSTTFEGRDVFAPAAAKLALGAPLGSLGTAWTLRVRPPRPEPSRTARGIRGEIVYVDRFGNAITNVPSDWLPTEGALVEVEIGAARPRRLHRRRTYEELRVGQAGVLGSSFGTLEISVRESSSAARFGIEVGTSIRFRSPAAASEHRSRK
ncbi:MAG TPA: SAM-dependent chlorinase/fluorinase [Thermoplasmata archaeon]|nr:SAM-dependent chlorinase/fluorinase [Thermoplasmata archaeon]